MLVEAAREHGLELSRCWMVGDQIRDTLAGKRAGCRGSLLLRTGQGSRFLDQTADYDHAATISAPPSTGSSPRIETRWAAELAWPVRAARDGEALTEAPR